jgi:hypothetical protein
MKKVFFIFALIFSFGMRAQAPSNFIVKFGGDGVDVGYGVKETYHRQYITIGSTTSYGQGESDAYLALIDSMGQGIWQATFGGVLADVGKSILVNPSDSGFVFTGFTNSFGNGGYDIYVVRTDKYGNLKWQSSFGGLDWDFGNDLVFSSDGNVIVCGSTFSSGYGKKDGSLLKINIGNGSLLWQKTFGGPEDDEFLSINATSDGYYTVAGNTKSYGDINNDFWLFKINTLGDSISSTRFGNLNKSEMCYDFIEDNNNNLVFCGSYDTSFYNVGKNISYIIKTDLNGAFITESKIAGAFTPDDKFLAITNMKSGNQYFLSRYVNHVGGYGIDVQPYLLNYNFIFLAANTYGGTNDDVAYDVISTKDNGYLMIGYTNGYGLVSEDVFLIKLDSTINTAQLLVGIKENGNYINKNNIYYFENVIYFENQKNELVNFQILNSSGEIIQSGSTNESYINLNPDLNRDMYVVRIIGKSELKTKFIKN